MVYGAEHMRNDYHILVDSDAFVGWILKGDAHYEQVGTIFTQIKDSHTSIVTTSAVVDETATVLSHRQGQGIARAFLEQVIEQGNFPVIFVSESIRMHALKLFVAQKKKGTSMTDCINVAVCTRMAIPYIFSFDKAYPTCFGIDLVESKVPREGSAS
jgi:predicted nucleic acid-binding protein